MFKNTFQSGFLSVLYSIGSKPLLIWDKKVKSFRKVFSVLLSQYCDAGLIIGEEWTHQKDHGQ